MTIISQSYTVMTSYKTANNIPATIIQIERNNVYRSKQVKNQPMNWIKMEIISQSYKVIIFCQTANNIHATIIQIKKTIYTNLSK